MLSNAKPLWAALPAGTLKRQLLAELAAAGRDDADQLLVQWGQAEARSSARENSPARPAQRRSRPVGKGAANGLDRAIWLLLQRSDLWDTLDAESHDLLAAQPSPYEAFFGRIEQCVHEHGPLAPAALLAELQQASQQDQQGAAVLSRIAGFHDPEPNSDIARELSLVIANMRLQAVDEELKLLFESGVQSPDVQRRSRELMASRRQLKAASVASSGASTVSDADNPPAV